MRFKEFRKCYKSNSCVRCGKEFIEGEEIVCTNGKSTRRHFCLSCAEKMYCDIPDDSELERMLEHLQAVSGQVSTWVLEME